jgi:putative oxidoreductase
MIRSIREPIVLQAYRFVRFVTAKYDHGQARSSLREHHGGPTMSGLFPNVSLALLLLRGMVALIFLAHAVMRFVIGTVPQFALFLDNAGFPQSYLLVLLISAYEISGGILLALGVKVKWVCAGLMFIVLMGIVLIHARLGWFVGEHGVGGMEFSWLLVFTLLLLAAVDHERGRLNRSVDFLQTGASSATS